MSKSIKSVEFVFENCESLVLNYPDIFMFNIWGEKECYHSYCNCITLSTTISGFYAGISKNAKPTDESCYWCSDGEEQEPRLSRLEKYQDITQVIVNFCDSNQRSYFVEWSEGDDIIHSGQKLVKTEEGHILYTSLMDGSFHHIPSSEQVDAMADMVL